MQTDSWQSLLLRVLLPFLVAVTINIFPVPHAVIDNLRQAVAAENALEEETAARHYLVVSEMQPWRTDLWEKTGILFFNNGAWEEVAALFSGLYERGQLSVEKQFMLAEAYYQLKAYDQAVTIWSELLAANHADEDLFAKVAETQNMLGSYDALVATYHQWISRYPENAHAYYRLGMLLALEDPSNALPMLTLAKTFDPGLAPNVDRLVEALNETAETDGAYQSLQIGRAFSSVGEWEFASQAFEAAVEADPNYGEAWAFLAEAYQQLKRPSYQTIQKANAVSPDSVVVKALTAMYWRRQNDPAQALLALDEIIVLEPDEEVWLVEKGNVFAQSGDLNAAREMFAQAIEREPAQGQYRRELIRFCVQNNYEVRSVALPAARQYLLADGESSQALDMMGWVLLTLKDTTNARRYLVRALEMEPLNASAHLHLGQVYLALDDKPLALAHFKQAAALENKDFQSAAFAKELLDRYFPGSG